MYICHCVLRLVLCKRIGTQIGSWYATSITPSAEWTFNAALELPAGFTGFNTAVGRGVLGDGTIGFAMAIEVRAALLGGGFQIIIATAPSLDGPWTLGISNGANGARENRGQASAREVHNHADATPLSSSSGFRGQSVRLIEGYKCSRPTSPRGYCVRPNATPTHVDSGVLRSGPWPKPTVDAAATAVADMCSSNPRCAGFGLANDDKVAKQYQLYPASATVLHPLSTPDWTLYYRNASCCAPQPAPPPPPPARPARVFGPGSCPALRYDPSSGYWHILYTPNPTVPNGDYRTWQIYAARSQTLETASWEPSPRNPVMVADAFDRVIHNSALPLDEQKWAANTTNLNDSDPDLVEFEGHVLFVGNWGDQRSTPTNSLFQAVFNGTMEEFWRSLYYD